jgi:hypothetical protein
MARIPRAQAGLVFRYAFLRLWQYQQGAQTSKDRPCCLLLPLKEGQVVAASQVHNETDKSLSIRYVAQEGEVLILLIQSDKPGHGQIGLELGIDDKQYVGLSAHEPSYVIVSEVNLDKWPNPDMSLVPGRSNTFTYDRPLSGPAMSRIATAFLKAQRENKVKLLVRHP